MTKKLQMCTKKTLPMFGQGFLIVSITKNFSFSKENLRVAVRLSFKLLCRDGV